MESNVELKQKVKKFYKLLEDLPDRPSSAFDFIAFFRQFLRINVDYLPTIEVMTLLRNEKPQIYYSMRQFGKKDAVINILVDLNMEVQVAQQRLNEIVK